MEDYKKILLCVNSDIGKGNSIGFRFAKIAQELKKRKIDFKIIARDNYSNFLVATPFYKNYLARILKGIRIYLFPFFDNKQVDIFLFDRFVLRKIKKMKKKGEVFSLSHFGEPLPRSMSWLKKEGGKVFLDIPIGHYKYSLYLQEKGFQLDSKAKKEKFIDEGISLADLLITPSSFVNQTLDLANWDKKPKKVINFGSDQSDLSEGGIENRFLEWKNGNRPLSFVFMGAVNFRKGVNFLFSAWEKANLKKSKLIVGGYIYKSMRRELRKYDLKNVKLLGFAEDWKDIMKESDVFLFPSLLEGSSKAVFEALSYGLPVITTPNSGSVVGNEKEGFIIPIGDSDLLAEKIKYLHDNPDRILEMSKAALKKSKEYTWDKYSLEAVDLYQKEV